MLPLPISPTDFNGKILTPALHLLPPKMDSIKARTMLVAIGLQESGLNARVQSGNGPAHGLLQFEAGGGVKGVMTHPASKDQARAICAMRGVEWERQKVWEALASDDILAAVFGRLLLWTDPKSIPDDEDGCWDLYSRVWRPGKPHRDRWSNNYKKAVQLFQL